jgi:hypothetical protein
LLAVAMGQMVYRYLVAQTQAVVVVEEALEAMEALASSLFVIHNHNQHQPQQLAHPKSTTLMATKYTLGHHLEL